MVGKGWDRGHRLPRSLTCCATPTHIPLWASLFHLQPKRARRDSFIPQHSLSTYCMLGPGLGPRERAARETAPPCPLGEEGLWGRQASLGFREDYGVRQ